MSEILWRTFETVISIFECCTVIRFICTFLHLDFKKKSGKKIFLFGVLIDFVTVTIINQLIVYEGALGFSYILVYSIFAIFFLDGTVFQKIFVSLVSVMVLICVGAGVSSIIATSFKYDVSNLYEQKSLARFCSIIIIQTLVVLIYDLILKISVSSLKKSEWGLILSILVLSFMSLSFIHYTIINSYVETHYSIILMFSEFGIIVTNIVCFYMTYTLNRSNKEAENFRMIKQQEEYRTQYAENIKEQYEEVRRMRHDMKQNLAVISTLQKEGKYSEAFDYANKISDRLSRIEILVDVGNDFINAILNSKLSTAKLKGIEVICSSVNNIDGIEDIDLCTLLGNLLDNAIEAAEKCSNAFVEVSLRADDNKIFVRVANSIGESILSNNSELKSTKNDSKLHGYGIKTIRSIAEKYDGIVSFYEEKFTFYSHVTLYK